MHRDSKVPGACKARLALARPRPGRRPARTAPARHARPQTGLGPAAVLDRARTGPRTPPIPPTALGLVAGHAQPGDWPQPNQHALKDHFR
jgi:hypothetical protein